MESAYNAVVNAARRYLEGDPDVDPDALIKQIDDLKENAKLLPTQALILDDRRQKVSVKKAAQAKGNSAVA